MYKYDDRRRDATNAVREMLGGKCNTSPCLVLYAYIDAATHTHTLSCPYYLRINLFFQDPYQARTIPTFILILNRLGRRQQLLARAISTIW